jgi:hypothetical protein
VAGAADESQEVFARTPAIACRRIVNQDNTHTPAQFTMTRIEAEEPFHNNGARFIPGMRSGYAAIGARDEFDIAKSSRMMFIAV